MKIKVILACVLSIVSVFLFSAQSHAQTASQSAAAYQTPNTDADVPENLTTYSQSVVIELLGAVGCQMFGVDPARPNSKCLGVNPETGKIGFVENGGGLVAVMGNMIGSLYYFPVSSGEYTRYLASSFVGNKQTLAADEVIEGGNGSGGNGVGTTCTPDKACPQGLTCSIPPNGDPNVIVGTCVTAQGNQCTDRSDCAPNEFCAPLDPSLGSAGVCAPYPASYVAPGTPTPPANNQQPNARGYGFGGLRPFLNIWTVFRNIAYLFYVAGFVFIGLGIVLRLPVDSRAVMSLQNQIPKIIISLILLTFSYAIAGFLIDLMYIIIFLVYNILSTNSTLSGNVSTLNPIDLQGSNPFSAIGGLGGGIGIANSSASLIGDMVGSIFSGTGGGIATGLIAGLIGAVSGFALGNVPGAIIGGALGLIGVGGGVGTGLGVQGVGYIIAFFVIGFALLSSLFRIWFKLITAYVMFIFTLILGPFWIMGGIFPGVKFSFGAWVKTMIGHLSVFPTVVVMFMLGKVIIASVQGSGNQPPFVPPLIGDAGDLKGLAGLIGLGVILATPSIMDNVKGAFGTSGIPTQSIGQAIGTGQQLGGTIVGLGKSALWGHNKHGHPTGIINTFGMPWFWNKVSGGHSHGGSHGQVQPQGFAAGALTAVNAIRGRFGRAPIGTGHTGTTGQGTGTHAQTTGTTGHNQAGGNQNPNPPAAGAPATPPTPPPAPAGGAGATPPANPGTTIHIANAGGHVTRQHPVPPTGGNQPGGGTGGTTGGTGNPPTTP